MLSINIEHSETNIATKVVRLPSPSMSISQGINAIVCELQLFDINTIPLHCAAQELDMITASASNALEHGDVAGVHHFLEEAINTMREAVLILKLLCIMERNQLPGDVLDHLSSTRDIIQQAMNDAGAVLCKGEYGYSSTA